MYKEKTMRKFAVQKIVERAGFKAWMIPRPAYEMYAMLLIACNRLCPDHPERAYMMLAHHLRGIGSGVKADPTKWKCAEVRGREGLMLEALKTQQAHGAEGICPVCSGVWDTDKQLDQIDDAIFADQSDACPPGFVECPDMSKVLPPSPMASYLKRHFER